MAFDKVVEAKLFGISNQQVDIRMTTGESSSGFTAIKNPLRGTLMWDDCYYVLQGVSVSGGATGGSFTVTIHTDAVLGYTGLPIARATLGPLTKSTVVMDNLHHAKASPVPTHIDIDQTAAGGVWLQCYAVAKQYRGTLSTPGVKTSERVIMGNLIRGASVPGAPFADGKGFVADATVTLGTSGTTLGLHKLRTWDQALYWVVAGDTLSGTHDVNLVGRIGGNTFTFASTGAAGALSAAKQKVAIASLLYGQSPNPTAIIWDVVNAGGVSDARVVVLAKSGRGSLAKS